MIVREKNSLFWPHIESFINYVTYEVSLLNENSFKFKNYLI